MRRIWAREFIRVWQSSSTRREVAEKLRMSSDNVRQRVKRYRRNGIPLKEMEYTETWTQLAEYAKELAEKSSRGTVKEMQK